MNWYYLKNIKTGEIVDVKANSLLEAKKRCSQYLGDTTTDWEERF